MLPSKLASEVEETVVATSGQAGIVDDVADVLHVTSR